MALDIPDPTSVDRVADWVEYYLSHESHSISKAALSSFLQLSGGSEPSDHFLDGVWREIDRRNQLYGNAIFSLTDFSIASPDEFVPSSAYLACLLLSLNGVQDDVSVPARLFERLASAALSAYLSATTTHLGWPIHPQENDTPPADEPVVKQRVERIALSLNERYCEDPPSRFKDRGVDTIGWIPFGDSRSGQVVILLQSAAGHHWRKKRPVPLTAWCQYVHWACNPIAAFAVPSVIRAIEWHEASTDLGLLLDRPRMIRLLQAKPLEPGLDAELSDWVNSELVMDEG